MYDNIISKCPYPLDLFLDKISSYILINLSTDLSIKGFNEKFLKTVSLSREEIKEKKLTDIFSQSSLEEFDLSAKKYYQRTKLCFQDTVIVHKLYNQYIAYLFNLDDGYFLIAKEDNPEQDEILNKISKLNNEAANKARELSRKNIKLEKAKKQIEELLKTDKLTGLSNRRYFMEYFEKMIANAQRHSNPLSLVICDLDHFKGINDNYGHAGGDRVLVKLGELLLEETRKGDLASRIGGEEFTIILNQTPVEEAINYAERIRKMVSELQFEKIDRKVTISMGITQLKETDDAESFLKRADDALYQAKNSGRNKAEVL